MRYWLNGDIQPRLKVSLIRELGQAPQTVLRSAAQR